MKFVTRKHIKVDRVACPWLIRRFVDPGAEFLFVEPDQVLAVAAREEAIAFDVPGAGLGHRGAECSFDAVIKAYTIAAPGLDLEPECRGLKAIAEGFRAVGADDDEILRLEFPAYDALFAYCQEQAAAR